MQGEQIIIGENKYTPRFSQPDYRSRNRENISYYDNGAVKSIYLEGFHIINTPIGKQQAELVSFYESGKLRRIFPVYGLVSAYWSEQDESNLVPCQSITVGGNTITGKISCINLYESGQVKSLTLWPGEKYRVKVGDVEISGRIGISFYESGAVKSVEPAVMTSIRIGEKEFKAFDFRAIGISGDNNSLKFDENGNIIAFASGMSYYTISGKEILCHGQES